MTRCTSLYGQFHIIVEIFWYNSGQLFYFAALVLMIPWFKKLPPLAFFYNDSGLWTIVFPVYAKTIETMI